jgi:F1F0 ATPase subunit 2
MMSSGLPLILAWLAGVGLGLFYFGGLWLTVRQLPHYRRPALLLVGSFLGRTAVLLVGLYFVMGGHGERALACLVGIVMTRILLVSRLRPERVPDIPRGKAES